MINIFLECFRLSEDLGCFPGQIFKLFRNEIAVVEAKMLYP
jgi:hypothetical protein